MALLLDYDKPAPNGFPTFPDRPGASLPGPSRPVKSLPLLAWRGGLEDVGETISSSWTPKSRTTLYLDRHDNQNAADGGIISFRSLTLLC